MKKTILFMLLMLPATVFAAQETVSSDSQENVQIYTVPLPLAMNTKLRIDQVMELQKMKITIFVINTGTDIRSYWLDIVDGGLMWVPIGYENKWRPFWLPEGLVPQEEKD